MNLVELCRSFTSIDSSISHGTKEISSYAHELAQAHGLHSEIFYENYNGVDNANVMITPVPFTGGKNILLSARLDTPDPGEYGRWVKNGANPFSASINGNEIYGLGIADAKADFVCKLAALKNTNKKKFSKAYPILLGTFGGASGAGAIRMARRKKMQIEKVLVGAPTQMTLASKGPGYAKVEIRIPFTEKEKKYRSVHDSAEGSVSQNKLFSRSKDALVGDMFLNNPILKLMEYLKKLPEGTAIISVDGGTSSESIPDTAYLELDLVEGMEDGILHRLIHIEESLRRLSIELKSVNDEDCVPPYSTITVGQIRTYPEEIKLSGICRLIPARGRDLYESWLDKLRLSCSQVGAEFQILDYKPPFATDTDGEYFKFLMNIAESMKLNPKISAAVHCTEANVFHRLGAAVACFGPGDLQSDNLVSQEHIFIKDLEKTREFYEQVIERYCQ